LGCIPKAARASASAWLLRWRGIHCSWACSKDWSNARACPIIAGNRFDVRSAELLYQEAAVAVNQQRLRAMRLGLVKRCHQRSEFGFVVAASGRRHLRQGVAGVPSGSVRITPMPMRPGLGRALPSQ
jgi:hypothetical protein